jgi:hypothetical protein
MHESDPYQEQMRRIVQGILGPATLNSEILRKLAVSRPIIDTVMAEKLKHFNPATQIISETIRLGASEALRGFYDLRLPLITEQLKPKLGSALRGLAPGASGQLGAMG